ncbi:MAG: MFS transporter [Caulobacteraceae bacterium]|nr:MFS transporter [Caulobacteraceae bacterium]
MADAALPMGEPTSVQSEAVGPAPPTASRAGIATKFFYGFGSIAFGVKDNGFQTILLLFYNQVVGLPAAMVGAAILLALAVDAVMDPIVGQISDNLRTPWGRRHPFMYASALPLGLSYLLLWNPPHASQGVQFVYLVVVAIIVRTFISFYEAPSSALAPELTTDYRERTSLLGYRVFFAWFGGLSMSFLAFTVLLRPDETHPVGQLNPAGYAHYGMVAGAVMAVTILISALGTHSRIKTFTVPPQRRIGLGGIIKEMGASLSNRSFVMLLLSSLFSSTATGLAFSMNLYFYTYLWALSAGQISVFAVASLVAAALATALAAAMSGRDKRRSAIVLFIAGMGLASAPQILRLLGWFPVNGSPVLFPLLLAFNTVGLSPMIAASILGSSMIADVVEDSQVRTGRRSEGLFFAVNSFVQKAVSGLGIFMSSAILTLVHFPAKAGAGGGAPVDPAIVRNLALIYLPVMMGLYLISMAWLSGYRITRQTHEANLEQLARAKEAGAGD